MEMYDVKQIIYNDPESNILEIKAEDITMGPKVMADTLTLVKESRKALLFPGFASEWMKPIICEVMPDMAGIMGYSKKRFAPGMLNVFTSFSIDPDLKRWLNFQAANVVEASLLPSSFHQMAQQYVPSITGKQYVGKICDPKHEATPLWAFGLGTFDPIFRAYFIANYFAAVLLLIEVKGWHRITRVRQKSKKRKANPNIEAVVVRPIALTK